MALMSVLTHSKQDVSLGRQTVCSVTHNSRLGLFRLTR